MISLKIIGLCLPTVLVYYLGCVHVVVAFPVSCASRQTTLSRSEPLVIVASSSSSSSSSADDSYNYPTTKRGRRRAAAQNRDVVIVGGGLAGLSAALYLSQMDSSRHVTILEREHPEHSMKKTIAGSFAAAGMLAPQSERLPKGSLLDLCIASRRMFPDFVDLVESLAQESGTEGSKYLWKEEDDSKSHLNPWCTGYVASGGFLAPAFAGDSVATWAPPEDSGSATWLDAFQVRELEPNLHPDVVGGWWFPEDASVDARRLTCCLRAACVAAGVQLLCGPEYEITSLDLSDTTCHGLWIQNGRYIAAKSILVANGSWMRNLLPVPIEPHKGQSMSLRMPADRPPLLRRVLFAQDSYIVPKADGRIVVGATVEAGNFDPNVTPAGLLHILTHALQLVPGLKDLPVEETWAGLRPTTPDKGPILGKTLWDNLYLAGGYWRNGVLLAPKTGQLLAGLLSGQELCPTDQSILDAFSWDRFTSPGKGIALAAQSRYAASIHPIHSRRSGAGVAASVGTELGVYSSARSAAEERQRDRSLLMQEPGSDQEAAFERAASMGKLDSAAYTLGDNKANSNSTNFPGSTHIHMGSLQVTERYEGSADALTVGSATSELTETHEEVASSTDSSESLEDVYQTIRANKARQAFELDDSDDEARPDPGFRIYHLDESTGQAHEVPPYTTPGDFLVSLQQQQTKETAATATVAKHSDTVAPNGAKPIGSLEHQATQPTTDSSSETYNEHTYDGYQDIQQANSRSSRQEELHAMREARRRNRLGQSSIDTRQIGAQRIDE